MNKFFIFAIVLLCPFDEIFAQTSNGKALEPKSDFKISTRLRIDNVFNNEYQSTDRKDEFKNNYLRIDVLSNATYKKNWFGYLNYRIQETPFQASEIERRRVLPNGGGDKTFENNAGVLRELHFGYENDKFKVYGGKFRPYFGLAYRVGRGIWLDEIASDYSPLEKLGFGGVLKAGNEKTIGQYQLGVSVFTHDRKNLDNSQFTTRDPVLKSEGRPSDTRSLQSYNISLEVNYDFSNEEKLFYRFAYINMAVNANALQGDVAASKIEDQKGIAATMKYQKPVSKNYNFDLLIDYVNMDNVLGNTDISDRYFVANIINNFYNDWNLTLGYAGKRRKQIDYDGEDKDMTEISAGYTFTKNKLFDKLNLQIGQKHFRTNNKIIVDKRNSYAAMLRYTKTF